MYKQNEQVFTTVAEALEKKTVDELKKFLPLLSASQKFARKADLVAFISRHLYGGHLRVLWEQLDDLQQAAVAETIHAWEGRFHPDRFEAKYGQLPDFGSSDRWEYKSKPSLLRLFIYNDVMPDEMRRQLKPFAPEPEETTLNVMGEIPETFNLPWKRFNSKSGKYDSGIQEIPITIREMERSAQRDVKAVLRLIDLGRVQSSNKIRQPASSTMEVIASVLEGGDYYDQPDLSTRKNDYEEEIKHIKAFAWLPLVRAAGFAELSGKRLSLTQTGKKALALPTAEVIRITWQRWLKTRIFDEFRRIDCIEGQEGSGKHGFAAADKRREVIASALKVCPIGEWVKVDDFFRYMQAADFSFEVHTDPANLYIADSYYGNLGYRDCHGWNILQGRYALCFLFEYASTLGIIDVAYIPPAGARDDFSDLWGATDLEFLSRYDGLLYFRLTHLGGYCLGKADTCVPTLLETKAALQVYPNLEVVIAGDGLSPADALLLDTYAEKVSDSTWRIEQAKLLKAFEDGRTISELQGFLQTRSVEPLPGAVKKLLKDIEHRASLLQYKGVARLIKCADPALAALIANDSTIRRFCLMAGESYIVVPAENESQFRTALRGLGYAYQIASP